MSTAAAAARWSLRTWQYLSQLEVRRQPPTATRQPLPITCYQQYDMAMVLPLATFDEAPPTKNADGLSGHDIIQLLHFRGLGT